jgi:hypothetical protein
VAVERLVSAVPPDAVETLRPLLPVGYDAGVRAYQQAIAGLTPRDLAGHYTDGLTFFHEMFVPHLKRQLELLSGGAWDLGDHVAYAAGTDVDFMTHLVEAVAARQPVTLFPGDWYGFLVGCTQTANIRWDSRGGGEMGCLCIPSVRNGHLTDEMLAFLLSSRHCLLNLNLMPTLVAAERQAVCRQLAPVLDRSILSVSFSRGFGLTASQLGVALMHRDHPYRRQFQRQWDWFTYFFNAIAARAFLFLDVPRIQEEDEKRRSWVREWLTGRGLPAVESGSYYVKAFRPTGSVPDYLNRLQRDGLVRLCFKPPVSLTARSQ